MKITNTVRYVVTEPLAAPVKLMFMNRKGGYDTLHLTKFKLKEIDAKPETYNTAGISRTFKVDSTSKTTYYSTYLKPDEFEWLKDLAVSPVAYIDGKYVKVIAIKGLELDNYNDLWNFEITTSPEFEENKITL